MGKKKQYSRVRDYVKINLPHLYEQIKNAPTMTTIQEVREKYSKFIVPKLE